MDGFRKKKNRELAILEFIHKVLPAIERRSHVICLFLVHNGCFDTINRDILCMKIERYGVRGIAVDLVKSYYENRMSKSHFE